MEWQLVFYVAIALLGIAIASTAVQAYRRNGESVMLYVAAGFLLVSSHGVVEYVVVDVLDAGEMTGEVIEIAFVGLAMLAFFYALFGPVSIGDTTR